MDHIYTAGAITGPRFGHAWRDQEGKPHGTVYLNTAAHLDFSDPELAREVAAVLLTCANAMETPPPAEGGQQP